jgi:hypothetical protein
MDGVVARMERNGRHYLGIDFRPGTRSGEEILFDLRDAFMATYTTTLSAARFSTLFFELIGRCI